MDALIPLRLVWKLCILAKTEATESLDFFYFQIAATGYCFGGLCGLDLARFGAQVKGWYHISNSLQFNEILSSLYLFTTIELLL